MFYHSFILKNISTLKRHDIIGYDKNNLYLKNDMLS